MSKLSIGETIQVNRALYALGVPIKRDKRVVRIMKQKHKHFHSSSYAVAEYSYQGNFNGFVSDFSLRFKKTQYKADKYYLNYFLNIKNES